MNNEMNLPLMMQIVNLIGSLPIVVINFVGGVFCLKLLSTRPRESWLVGGAIGLVLFATLGVSNLIDLLISVVPGLVTSLFGSDGMAWRIQMVYSLPTYTLYAAGWGLILYAAFGEGAGPQSRYLNEETSSD